jgi:small subunit ribosomal protein S2
MILRSIVARSGTVCFNSRPCCLLTASTAPRALARHPRQASRPLGRFLSTATESIEASTENSLKQLQSIEAQLNTHLQQPVPSVDPETHGTSEAVSDNVAEQYYLYKQQCMTTASPPTLPY